MKIDQVCPPVTFCTASDAEFAINLVSVQRRQDMFLEAFSRKVKPMHIQTPFSVFVKKLQESLTRMEPYEVVTIAQGVDGASDAGVYIMASADIRKQIQGEVLRRCSLVNSGSG